MVCKDVGQPALFSYAGTKHIDALDQVSCKAELSPYLIWHL